MGEDQEAKIKELEQKLDDKPIDVNITDENWTKNLVAFVIIALVVMWILTSGMLNGL